MKKIIFLNYWRRIKTTFTFIDIQYLSINDEKNKKKIFFFFFVLLGLGFQYHQEKTIK
jgi:hypothetical protein